MIDTFCNDRLRLPVSPVVKALRIRPVWGHHGVQGGSTWAEALLFRLVLKMCCEKNHEEYKLCKKKFHLPKYEAHELCHTVPMIVRWPESFLRHRPPFQKHVLEFYRIHKNYLKNKQGLPQEYQTRQKSPRWKNDKVCNCCSFFSAGTGQHSEDTGGVFSWDYNWIFGVFFRGGITLGHCGQSSRCSQHRSWQDCTGEIIKSKKCIEKKKKRI